MPSGLLPGVDLIPVPALIAPPGTRMLFNNSSVPLGWAQDVSATFNDASVRTVNGVGGNSGGSTLWSSWSFGGTFSVNTFTLSGGQLAAHAHLITDPQHSHSGTTGIANQSLNHTHTGGMDTTQNLIGGASGAFVHLNTQPLPNTGAADLTAHTHNFGTSTDATGITTTQNAGSGAGITPNYTTPLVKYSDYIIGIKS